MSSRQRVPVAGLPNNREPICPESSVDEMLESTPPSEITDGSPPKIRRGPYVRNDAGRVVRPPDKRTRVEPEKAEIPKREGGPVLF